MSKFDKLTENVGYPLVALLVCLDFWVLMYKVAEHFLR